jgi:transcriptional regulator with XRE-family HTH domain
MPRNVNEILASLPEPRRKAILAGADAMLAEEMTLAEIRKMVLGSQAALAKKMGIKQAAVSRLERRANIHLSTLKQLIGAMGGEMKVVAQFADRPSVEVNLCDALDLAGKSTNNTRRPRSADHNETAMSPLHKPRRRGVIPSGTTGHRVTAKSTKRSK